MNTPNPQQAAAPRTPETQGSEARAPEVPGPEVPGPEVPGPEVPGPEVIVIGAGLAGLAAAGLIAQAGRSVTVYEKLGTVGGQARSVTRDGFIFNQGPHALYRGGPAERVLTDLGVSIRGGKPPVAGRIVMDGKADLAPADPLTLLRTRALGARDKVEVAKVLARLPKLHAPDYARVSVADWIAGVVSRPRPSEMMHALVRLATYVNQPDQLSADTAITQLQSVIDGEGVLYLDHGWQSLVDQLSDLPGVTVQTGEACETLPDAPVVIVAVGGAEATGRLLGTSFDVGPAAAASCIDLGLNREPQADFVLGGDVPFYFSNHSSASDVAPSGMFHAALAQYLPTGQEPDNDALHAFARHAGVSDDHIVTTRRLHRMTTVTSIPTAQRGGLAGRPAVTDSGHDNVFIAGDWVGPVGHLGDASLASAEAAAQAALAQLHKTASAPSASSLSSSSGR